MPVRRHRLVAAAVAGLIAAAALAASLAPAMLPAVWAGTTGASSATTALQARAVDGTATDGAAEAPAETPVGMPAEAIAGTPVVLLAAGDIADCSHLQDAEATAGLLDTLLAGVDGIVAPLGDLAYERGTAAELALCYGPTWGRHRERTRPAPGNHDYGTARGAPYFAYFAGLSGTGGAPGAPGAPEAPGAPGRGYYSYDHGAWHVVVLDTNCALVSGGCGAGSPQEQWLRADLAASAAQCTVAYAHHPRFSSAAHGSAPHLQALWQALVDHRVALFLAGHDHTYERFARQDAHGNRDDAQGVRQIVVGTGGRSHYAFGVVQRNSEVRHSGTYGLLRLTLRPGAYDWEFVPVAGGAFTDSGASACA